MLVIFNHINGFNNHIIVLFEFIMILNEFEVVVVFLKKDKSAIFIHTSV
jgi:hypothetical protein